MAADKPQRSSARDVAVVGMACRFADAPDLDTFWRNIKEGRQSFSAIPKSRWDHTYFHSEKSRANDKTYVQKGAFIDDVDHFAALEFGVAPKRVEVMDPQHRLALEVSREALQDASFFHTNVDKRRVGTFLGVVTSEYRNLTIARSNALLMASGQIGVGDAQAISASVENGLPITAFTMPGTLLNMTAANVARQWKFGGPAFTIDAACTSSLAAIHDAVTHIRAGICDAALAGGVYLNLTPESLVGFSRIGAISRSGEMRPFDEKADGFLQGDGCGIVVLKSYDKALQDGDRIYAVIRGTGINNDGDSPGPMAPSRAGQFEAVVRAYEDAEIDPSTVGFVSCHGTATPVGDPVEVGALFDAMKDAPNPVFLGSVKANVGHTMGAAGVAGFIHATMAVHNKTITPQAGFETPHPKLQLDETPFEIPIVSTDWDSENRIAGVSAFGFGGTNCHVVIEQADSLPVSTDPALYQSIVLSASTVDLLPAHARRIADEVETGGLALSDVAYTLNVGRSFEAARLAVAARTSKELVATLREACDVLDSGVTEGKLGPNAFVGSVEDGAPSIGFMYPGQGAQRLGLLEDQYSHDSAVRETIDRLGDSVGFDIANVLYAERGEEADARLRATEVCQPVMAALGLALTDSLRSYGVEPTATFGHSLGEFVACAAGGMLTAEETMRFVQKRGELMAALDVDDFGAMCAVMAGTESVAEHLAPGCVIANINHPKQTVISGSTEAVEQTIQNLERAEIRATPLRVSHAFHSPVVDAISDDLAKLAESLKLKDPACSVFSAITTRPYETAHARETFVRHTTSTVDFVETTKHVAHCVDIFIEVGAGTTLTSFVSGILDRPKVISLAAKTPDDGATFARALSQLVCWGVPVDFAQLKGSVVSLPASPLARQRYWARREKIAPLVIPNAETAASKDSPMTQNASSDLVALFREQAEILRQHADILAAQTAVLTGQPFAPLHPTVELPAAMISKPLVAEPVKETAAPVVDLLSEVKDAVASISAFPLASLKPTQGLVKDLGFDSLMFVDLISELQGRFDGLVVPQTAFDQNSTIQDIVDFVESGAGEIDPTSVDIATLPIQTYGVSWSALDNDVQFTSVPKNRILAIGFDADFSNWDVEVTSVPTFEEALVSSDFDGVLIRTTGALDERLKSLRQVVVSFPNVSFFHHVSDSRRIDPSDAAVAGFMTALARERTDTIVKNVDTTDLNALERVCGRRDGWYDASHDDGVWMGRALSLETFDQKSWLSKKDTVLVTGGTGAVGRVLAQEIAGRVKKVIVVGRRPVADVADVLKSIGKNVDYVQSDLVSLPVLDSVTAVLHCAGVTKDALIDRKTDSEIDDVLSGKVNGLVAAQMACAKADRFICCSSWSGLIGNAAQTDYAAANAYLDTFCTTSRHLSIAWPIWEGEGMAAAIPAPIRDQMKSEGVTFISPEEARATFATLLDGGARGHVAISRASSPRLLSEVSVEAMDIESHPFVAEHVLKSKPVVPFAFVMDRVARSAKRTRGWSSVELAPFLLNSGIELDVATELEVRATPTLLHSKVEVLTGSTQRYTSMVRSTDASTELPSVTGGKKATLELDTFYDELAFHGPRMRAIVSVDELSDTHLIGHVRTSSPNDWLAAPDESSWTIDPRVVDGSFQLVLYFLRSKHNTAAFPVAFDRYVQQRPFEGDSIKCTMTLESIENGEVVGSIYYEDEKGIAAWMDRLQARVFETGTDQPEPALDIPPEHYDISKFEEVEELQQRLQMAELMGISNPYFRAHEGVAKNTAKIGGREMVNFSSYNYLGLSGHPQTVEAAKNAIDVYGTSASASRVASGQIPLHEELEAELADLIKAEDALVFAAGHMTNETVIGHLFGKNDLIIHDALAHNSILTGAELSGAKRMSFPHNDYEALDRTLTQIRGGFEKVGIFVEGVYSMDGDIPDIPKFVELKKKHRALLYVDEAHSIGVIGKTGGGVREYFDLKASDADVWMGTLSKAFASCGGYVAGSHALIEFLKYTAPAFVFSAGISPANAAAANAALKEMKSHPELVQTLHKRSQFFLERCNEQGLDTGMSKDSAVVPVIVGNSIECLQLSENLAQRDINVQPIVYPAVDDSESRLRFFLSSTHTEAQLSHTAQVVAEELGRIRSGAAAE